VQTGGDSQRPRGDETGEGVNDGDGGGGSSGGLIWFEDPRPTAVPLRSAALATDYERDATHQFLAAVTGASGRKGRKNKKGAKPSSSSRTSEQLSVIGRLSVGGSGSGSGSGSDSGSPTNGARSDGIRGGAAGSALWYHPRVGRLLMWPSWLRHGVTPTTRSSSPTTGPRISMSYNVAVEECEGEYEHECEDHDAGVDGSAGSATVGSAAAGSAAASEQEGFVREALAFLQDTEPDATTSEKARSFDAAGGGEGRNERGGGGRGAPPERGQ
jgi:hypothetical protein